MDSGRIRIAHRFRGPHGCGNGGYIAGLLAGMFDDPARVTLKSPAPLDVELSLEWCGGTALLCDGGQVVASAEIASFSLDAPDPVSYETAEAAHATGFPGFKHPFPECFVCGPDRQEGDGLRIFSGPLETPGTIAAPWVPDPALADSDGFLAREFIHASLDCPGAFTLGIPAVVLGQMTAVVEHPVEAGTPHVVMGWEIDKGTRKHVVGTALYTAAGVRCARAQAIWVEVDPDRINR